MVGNFCLLLPRFSLQTGPGDIYYPLILAFVTFTETIFSKMLLLSLSRELLLISAFRREEARWRTGDELPSDIFVAAMIVVERGGKVVF